METPPFLGSYPHPGDRATRPREGTFRRPPLAELDGGSRLLAGNTEGCRVGRAWHRRAFAESLVVLRRASAPRGTLKPK